jgi:hypothetical protein
MYFSQTLGNFRLRPRAISHHHAKPSYFSVSILVMND